MKDRTEYKIDQVISRSIFYKIEHRFGFKVNQIQISFGAGVDFFNQSESTIYMRIKEDCDEYGGLLV